MSFEEAHLRLMFDLAALVLLGPSYVCACAVPPVWSNANVLFFDPM